MNKENLLILFSDILKEKNVMKARGFDERNYKPHQFTVGAKHQIAAEKENEGILTEEILQKIPCEHLYCNLSYEEHDSEKILVLQLTRDAITTEVNEELVKIKPIMEKYNVKTAAFADTVEKYKFINNGENTARDSEEEIQGEPI
jgi:hypothetical protein